MSNEASALFDRRQSAREAFHDDCEYHEYGQNDGLDSAIETATRVRITPEIVETAAREAPFGVLSDTAVKQIVKAAFEAAGFEVED